MICVIAGNRLEAQRWASSQLLEENEWFFPLDFADLLSRSNFHVVVTGTAGANVPPAYFERLLHVAKERGKIGRGK